MNGGQQSDGALAASGAEPAHAGRPRQTNSERLLIPRLGRNLCAACRLAFLRPAAKPDFHVDFAQIVALFIVNAMLACLSSFLIVDPPRGFNIFGLTSYATHQLVFIAGVLLVAAWLDRQHERSAFFVILLSAWVIVQTATLPLSVLILRGTLFEHTAWVYWGYFFFFVIWAIVIAGRALRILSRQSLMKLVLPLAGYVLVVHGMGYVIPPSQMWYSLPSERDNASSNPKTFVDAESTYYDQPRLLQASFDRLEPERPGVSDLYFVGFANFAHQDVFRNEIELVQSLMDERFDTRGRSLALINNAETIENVPLANRPNLRRALNGIGKRMNVDEDVLFLFMTSHGSRDGVLAARFWPLNPNDLSSKDLKEILDQSGIRFRILVVSACYSGTFIDPLKDDYTLILTASRKDRNSFGCSNDREFTYFGEHFFVRELGQGKPLLEAFEAARISLAEREKAEGFTSSEPQMHLGEQMRAKLVEIEARLGSR